MKIDFRKIDFKQGKYWFPLVLFVPIVAIAYFSCQMFAGTTTDTGMVTDSINTTITAPLFSLGVSAGDTEAVQKKTRKNAML